MEIENPPRMVILAAALAFIIFGLNIALVETVNHRYLAPLLIPLSALLGYRLGARGVLLIVASGIVLIPELKFSEWARFQALFDLYLISIAIGIIAASRESLSSFVPQPGKSTHLLLLLILMLMPLSIGIWGREIGDADLLLIISFHWVGLAALFMAGITRIKGYKVGLVLAGIAITSLLLHKLELDWRASDYFGADRADLPLMGIADLRDTFFRYRIDEVTEAIVGLFYYVAGRICGPCLQSGKMPSFRSSAVFVALLAIFVADLVPLDWLARGLDQAADLCVSIWSAEPEAEGVASGQRVARAGGLVYARNPGLLLAPLLGFVAALFLGVRGFLISLLMLTVLLTVPGIHRGYFPKMIVPLGTVSTMLGFGALGIAVRNQVTESADRWWSPGWALYLAFVLMISAKLGLPFHSVFLPLTIVVAVVLGIAAQRLYTLLQGKRLKLDKGWIALFALVFMLSTIWQHLGEMFKAVAMLASAATIGAVIDELDDWWQIAAITVIILCTLWLALSALQVLIARIPVCLVDIRRVLQVVKALICRTPMPAESFDIEPTVSDQVETQPSPVLTAWWHPLKLLQNIRSIVVWGGLLMVVASFVRPVVAEINEYHKDRREAAKRSASDGPPANVYLMQSAKYTFKGWGIRWTEQGKYSTKFETDWYIARATPDIRQRAYVRVGRDLHERSVTVTIHMQRKSRGLWVERNGDWRDESAVADKYEAQIFRRARKRWGSHLK